MVTIFNNTAYKTATLKDVSLPVRFLEWLLIA